MPADNRESSNPLVLHVRGVTGYGGGPEKTILNSPRFLRELGYECVCAYMHPPKDTGFETLRKRAELAEAELYSVPDRGAWDWRVLTRLIQFCRQQRVAVWHGHDYKSNALGLVARRFWPMKLVTTVHGWVKHTRRTPLYYAIDRRCLPRYDEVICVSADLHEECLRMGVAPTRCHLIENAIDVEDFRRKTGERQFDRGTLTLGAMGRLSPEKGFHHLIQAVVELAGEGIDCRLRIAGEGDQRPVLEKRIGQCEGKKPVELLGQVADIKSFYDDLDVFVLSSLREGLPNVLLEAMAMEVPVVATRVAGVPRLIADGKDGVLVEPDSVAALKEGLRTLCRSAAMRRELATAARSKIERQYSFQNRMRRVAALYDRLLGAPDTQNRAAAKGAS